MADSDRYAELAARLNEERARLEGVRADYDVIAQSRFHALRMLWFSLKAVLGFSSPDDVCATWSKGITPSLAGSRAQTRARTVGSRRRRQSTRRRVEPAHRLAPAIGATRCHHRHSRIQPSRRDRALFAIDCRFVVRVARGPVRRRRRRFDGWNGRADRAAWTASTSSATGATPASFTPATAVPRSRSAATSAF